jgi:hypothetical protein
LDSINPQPKVSLGQYLQSAESTTQEQGIVIYDGMKKARDTQRKNKKLTEVVDFTEFQKNKFLLDDEFLYLKRVGNPIEFVECTYLELMADGKGKKDRSKKNVPTRKTNIEYITMSRNVYLVLTYLDSFTLRQGIVIHIPR